jgi:hypothetical protein
VSYLTKLFTNAPEHLTWFSDDQIAQGLKYLIDTSIGMNPNLASDEVPATQRAAIWPAIATFFRDFLRPRSEETLGHLNENQSRLSGVTYM